jgi:hypothetical protein
MQKMDVSTFLFWVIKKRNTTLFHNHIQERQEKLFEKESIMDAMDNTI